ncbi:30S ribosomal protein S4e [archaeon CG10_big_fil_rev_8_21_14_0_10_43_11]|nr:MAG: 30S ribosomal protein S4e [archaeon CG10_big_fil_rev_8_21_14_0_10_43_11]
MKTKRLTAPKTWPIKRKHGKWIISLKGSNPQLSIPITIILRDVLGICENKKDVKRLLHLGKVVVNKKKIADTSTAVNLFDVVELVDEKQAWRLSLTEKGIFTLVPIKSDETDKKLVRVIGKKMLPGKKLQLNCNDGTNILAGKTVAQTGDSLLISLPEKNILKHVKLEKGALLFVTGGSHIGELAKMSDFQRFKGPQQDRIVLSEKKSQFETLEDYGFVLGTDKAVITIR